MMFPTIIRNVDTNEVIGLWYKGPPPAHILKGVRYTVENSSGMLPPYRADPVYDGTQPGHPVVAQ